MDMEDFNDEDDFGDLYGDVEVKASSAMKIVHVLSQLPSENDNIHYNAIEIGDNEEAVVVAAEEEREEVEENSESEDELNIVLNDDYDEADDNMEIKTKFNNPHNIYYRVGSNIEANVEANERYNNGIEQASQYKEDTSYIHYSLLSQNRHYFSLPRSRCIIDVNIDTFTQKPWRHPYANITDFFNFGFNENDWKNYCNHMEKLREQSFNSNKPSTSKSSNQTVCEDGYENKELVSDLKMINGKAIPVENCNFERFPSSDIWDPLDRDSDVIIQDESKEELTMKEGVINDGDGLVNSVSERSSKGTCMSGSVSMDLDNKVSVEISDSDDWTDLDESDDSDESIERKICNKVEEESSYGGYSLNRSTNLSLSSCEMIRNVSSPRSMSEFRKSVTYDDPEFHARGSSIRRRDTHMSELKRNIDDEDSSYFSDTQNSTVYSKKRKNGQYNLYHEELEQPFDFRDRNLSNYGYFETQNWKGYEKDERYSVNEERVSRVSYERRWIRCDSPFNISCTPSKDRWQGDDVSLKRDLYTSNRNWRSKFNDRIGNFNSAFDVDESLMCIDDQDRFVRRSHEISHWDNKVSPEESFYPSDRFLGSRKFDFDRVEKVTDSRHEIQGKFKLTKGRYRNTVLRCKDSVNVGKKSVGRGVFERMDYNNFEHSNRSCYSDKLPKHKHHKFSHVEDIEEGQINEKVNEKKPNYSEIIAKMEKRRQRFQQPITKDAHKISQTPVDNNIVVEVYNSNPHQRPARKRKWN